MIIEKRSGLFDMDWSAIWEYRELGYILVWRDITVRYKQTAIGVAWVVLQPLIMMLIFTAVFGKMAKVPSDGIWYPALSLTGLLPWAYFPQAVSRAGANANMVRKVYFPRLWLPFASVVSPLVDFALSMILLFGLLIYARNPFRNWCHTPDNPPSRDALHSEFIRSLPQSFRQFTRGKQAFVDQVT